MPPLYVSLLSLPLLALAGPIGDSNPRWDHSSFLGSHWSSSSSAQIAKPSIRHVNCSENVPPNVALELGMNLTDPTQTEGIPWPTAQLGPLPENMVCGRATVPVDYDHPKGEAIEIAYMTLKATKNPSKGTIFFSPGGPQEAQSMAWANVPNLQAVAGLGLQTFAGLEEYDVLTVDPRGYGQSNPPNCPQQLPDTTSWFLYNEKQYHELLAPITSYVDACKKTVKPAGLLDHLGAREIASDFEGMRVAIGEKEFNYIGISYGTYWGGEYIKRFPKTQGRVVLDAVLAHGMDPVYAINETVRSMNMLVERADMWCMHNSSCPFFGSLKGTIPAVMKNITAQAPRNISVFAKEAFKELAYGDVQFAFLTEGLAAIAEAIETKNYSIIDPLAQAVQTYRGLNGQFSASLGGSMCTDIGIVGASYSTFEKILKKLAPSDPYGFTMATETWEIMLMCAGYPVKPVAPAPAQSDKPMLWVTSDFDLNTPTGWIDFARQYTPHGAMVVRHGDDHGTFFLTPSQFPDFLPGRAEEVAFLVNGTLPARRSAADYSVLLPGDARVIVDPYKAPIGVAAGDLDPASS